MSRIFVYGEGRIPYRVDFDFHGYEEPDSEHRLPDWSRPNCYSNHAVERPGIHLPVIDIDVDIAVARPVVEEVFADADRDSFGWIESTTPGHWHVYIDSPIGWADYLLRLQSLVDRGVVEPGYVNAAEYRHATFVRIPGVAKPQPVAVPTLGDGEPW